MKVTILQGLPGSGKSSYAGKAVDAAAAKGGTVDREYPLSVRQGRNTPLQIVSADDYFTIDGEYTFDPTKLPEAHANCLRDFTDAVRAGYYERSVDHLFVDNTNTTVAEVAPYYALAQAYGAEVEILYFPCLPEVAAERNTHGVSRQTCEAMAQRLSEFEKQMPPWWVRRRYSAWDTPA